MSKTKKAVVTVAAAILFYLSYMTNAGFYFLIERDPLASSYIGEYEMYLILFVLVAVIIAGVWSIEPKKEN